MKYVEKNDPRETPTDDPREQTGEKPSTQTKTPWKDNPQRTTDPSQPKTPKPDLEKWQETNTH